MKVSGNFDVKLAPLSTYADGLAGVNLGRMSIDKTYHGGLKGQSRGEMLNAMTAMQGSAGYVAIEQFEGSLDDKQGSFVLQHFGTIDNGKDRLVLEVVPGSGGGELQGISGEMVITVENGEHFYAFEYLV